MKEYKVSDRYEHGRIIAIYPHYITVQTNSGYKECYNTQPSLSKMEEVIEALVVDKNRGKKWDIQLHKSKVWEPHEEHNLLYLRNKQGFSDEELAKIFKVSESSIRSKAIRLTKNNKK